MNLDVDRRFLTRGGLRAWVADIYPCLCPESAPRQLHTTPVTRQTSRDAHVRINLFDLDIKVGSDKITLHLSLGIKSRQAQALQ